jgi:hypothetical protein
MSKYEELKEEIESVLYLKGMDDAPNTIPDHREGYLDGWNDAVSTALQVIAEVESS